MIELNLSLNLKSDLNKHLKFLTINTLHAIQQCSSLFMKTQFDDNQSPLPLSQKSSDFIAVAEKTNMNNLSDKVSASWC